jgi:Uma2 family endonuclease
VISPHDRADEVDQKTQEWLTFGVQRVWVVYPTTERVFVYRQGERSPTVYAAGDTLEGGESLPGFAVAVEMLFG